MTNTWRITVNGCLRAHYLQKGAPSKPGADWFVDLHDGAKGYRVLVRTYVEEMQGMSLEEEQRTVAEYVGKLIERGWTPLQYTGKPGELTYTKQSYSLN